MTIQPSRWSVNALIVLCALAPPPAHAGPLQRKSHAARASGPSPRGVFVYSRPTVPRRADGKTVANSELFARRVPGGLPERLMDTKTVQGQGRITSVAIQPMGREIALICDRAAPISIRPFDRTPLRSRTLLVANFSRNLPATVGVNGGVVSCQWAPNGKSLAVLVHEKPMDRIWTVNPATGLAKVTAIVGPGAWGWTSDSRYILFTNAARRLVKQRPSDLRPAMTWRMPEPDMTPASSAVYPVLAAGPHSIVQFTSHGLSTLMRSPTQIISGEVFPSPRSEEIVFQTTSPEPLAANGREDMPLSADRDVEIWSPVKKRLKIPMRWSDSPAFGHPSYHIAGWTLDGENILMMHETLSPRHDLLPQVEFYLLKPSAPARQDASGKPILSPSFFRSDGPVFSIDFQQD